MTRVRFATASNIRSPSIIGCNTGRSKTLMLQAKVKSSRGHLCPVAVGVSRDQHLIAFSDGVFVQGRSETFGVLHP
jgi:hypothetical protein